MLETLKLIYGIVAPTPEEQIKRIKELIDYKPGHDKSQDACRSDLCEENVSPLIKENKELLEQALKKDIKETSGNAKKELERIQELIKAWE